MTEPTLADLLRRAHAVFSESLHTAIPGVVVSYDPERQKASVSIAVPRREATGDVRPWPVISGVPVVFPGGGGARMTFPLRRGDTVLLIAAERSIEEWVGGVQDGPTDPRTHSWNDAVAIPGLVPFSPSPRANGSDVVIEFGDALVRIEADGSLRLRGGSVIVESDDIRLGDSDLRPVLRRGDTVTITGGSSAGVYPVNGNSSEKVRAG